jgi:flavin reductase (DIM6/NTAB) family NADH-FMN oxidoreductase RutF
VELDGVNSHVVEGKRTVDKVDIGYLDGFRVLFESKNGSMAATLSSFLLVSSDGQNRPNVMTIGGAGIARAGPCGWVFFVYVAPSRYTYSLIEETGDYTVNVPRAGMEEIVTYCGTVTGREHDKFREKGLTTVPSRHVTSPIIGECAMHFECKVVCKLDAIPESMGECLTAYYKGSTDYHRLYQAQIKAIYADSDIGASL